MSRTKKGSKGPGYEFWSRRPGNGGSGRIGKDLTRGIERQQGKAAVREGIKEHDREKQ